MGAVIGAVLGKPDQWRAAGDFERSDRGNADRMMDAFLIEREPIAWSAPEGFPVSLAPLD